MLMVVTTWISGLFVNYQPDGIKWWVLVCRRQRLLMSSLGRAKNSALQTFATSGSPDGLTSTSSASVQSICRRIAGGEHLCRVEIKAARHFGNFRSQPE